MPHSRFIQALLAPYVPPPGKSEPVEEQLWFVDQPPPTPNPSDDPLDQPLYQATGDWRWINNRQIRDYRDVLTIEENALYHTSIRIGWVGNREIVYMNKAWRTCRPLIPFVTELSRYKTNLRNLQGSLVPTVIGVWSSPNEMNIGMALPNYTFFIEASPDMPQPLKTRVVEAFEKVTAAGVRLDQIRLQDFLVGADGMVTIVNHHGEDHITPSGSIVRRPIDPLSARMDLRELKFKLDYNNARREEREKVISLVSREGNNSVEEMKQRLIPGYSPNWERIDPDEEIIDPELLIEWSRDTLPRRFVVPGVSASTLQDHVRLLLRSVALEGVITAPPPAACSEIPEAPVFDPKQHLQSPRPPSIQYKTDRKHGKIPLRQRHPDQGVDSSIYLDDLHPTHPPIVVRDFAYESIQPLKFGKRRLDSDAESTQSRAAKRPRLMSILTPLARLWGSSGVETPATNQ